MINPSGLCQCGCERPTRLAPKNSTALGWVKGEPILRIAGHGRKNSKPEYIEDSNGCWIWQHSKDRDGYGKAGRSSSTGGRAAHRVIYEEMIGPVPAGLHLDHLCRVRACVNPAHLEPVTPRVNAERSEAPSMVLARMNECSRGHSLLDAYVKKNGSRNCRACNREDAARRRAELKAIPQAIEDKPAGQRPIRR